MGAIILDDDYTRVSFELVTVISPVHTARRETITRESTNC